MKYIKYLALGIVFGIVLSKAEVISWYRIYEMFRFQSFHMYGVIGTAVISGIALIQLVKLRKMKTYAGEEVKLSPKDMSIPRYLFGGTLFGMGWAMTGACPGPMFILLGHGIIAIAVLIASAVVGTFVYGLLRPYLPH